MNVSSVTGPLVSAPTSAGYSAGKAGVDGMMRGLAIEAGRYGVTVNSVAPGWIVTGSSLPDEVIAGQVDAARSPGPAGGGGRPDRVPRIGRRELHHRPVDRDRRRQHIQEYHGVDVYDRV